MPHAQYHSRPCFSVCIPAYEDIASFSRCLQSIRQQSLSNIEIVISDDSQSSLISRYVNKQKDPRIIYFRQNPKLGAPANWNAALHMAKGAKLTLLHQDDWYRNVNVLRTVLAAMDKKKADVLITGRSLYRKTQCLGEYTLLPDAPPRFLAGFPSKSLVINRLGQPGVFFFDCKHQSVLYDEGLTYFSDTDYYLEAAKRRSHHMRLSRTSHRHLLEPARKNIA